MDVYNREHRTAYPGFAVDVTILAGADPSATLAAARAKHTIYVTYIGLYVTTDHAATQTLRDSADTPVIIAASKASPGIGLVIDWTPGNDGIALTEGKALALAASGAGLAGRLHVEGYWKPSSTMIPSEI